MKTKIKLMALVAGLMSVLPMTSAWALDSSTYYAKLIVGISSKSPTGVGTVYAGSSAAAAQTSTATSVEGQGSDTTVTLYAYAKANRGFKFENWIAAQDGSGTPLSTDNPYACGIAASASKDDSSKRVPKTVYANFAVAPAVKVVFAAPDASNGDGYKYTADDGYDEYKVSDAVVGANGAEYNGFNSVEVTCTATHEKDEGKILGWWAKNENGEQIKVSQEESFTKLFTESMTVWPEFGKREKFVVTCKPAENGYYAVNDTVVSSEAQEVEGFDTLDAKLVATPAKGYAFYKWYENDDGRINYFADVATVEKHTFNKKVEIGAMFTARKQVAVTFDESASEEKVTRMCGNAEIDFDETDNGFVGYDSAKVTLTAIAEKDKQVKWWYRINGGDKIYFSIGRTVTWTFTEDAVVGVDFFESDNSLSKCLAGVIAGATVTVEADADVPDGAEITIPEGVTVSVSAGKTLFVDGKLTVLGTLTGEGTVSKCLKLLKQTGNGLEPCNPYGSVKYWKTAEAAANASIEGWSGTIATHLTVLRGDGVAVRGAISSTTKMVQCTFDTTKAVNHVTSIVAAFDAAEIVASNPYIFLADGEIKGPTRTDTSSGKTYTRISYSSTVDCAGHNCSLTKNALASQVSSNNRGVHLNAPVVNFSPGEYWQQGWATFYNCPNITMKSLKGEGNKIFLYDSGETMSFTQNSGGHAAPQFYSGKTTYDFSSSVLNDTTAIFGGAFKVKPADKRISSELSGSMEFHQHEDDDYWYLEPKTDQNVATIDGIGYETLEDAFKYFEEHAAATLTLTRDVMVPEVLTLPAGKKLTVELNGCKIEAPNGFIRNYGDLAIRDNANRMDVCGIYAGPEKCIIENFDGAAADVCYGVYQGDFLVNGGTLTTHYGRFTGNVTKRGGEVHLKGGIFSKDVSALMDEGYLAFNYGNVCYVGRFPRPYLTEAEIRDTDFAYELLAMSPADRDLYINMKSCALGDGIGEEDWKYVAELKSAYTFLGDNFLIDVLVKFDRPVVAGSAKVTVMSGGISFTEPVPEVAANEFRRELSPRITQTQIAYKYFIDDPDDKYDDLTAGFSDVKGANQGTTIFLAMELWKYHERKKFDKMDSYLTIIEKPTVFGAGANVAMLQAAEGPTPAESFFATLQAAVNAPETEGKTIKLCNDCGEDVTIAKSCTVDLNGFAFTGSFVKGEGVEETVAGDVHTFVATAPALPPVAKIGDVEYTSVSEAISAVKAGQTVVLLADCADDVTIAGWKLDTNGFALTGSVSPADGYMLSQFNGVYSGVLVVAKVGDAKYGSLQSAINAAKYAAKDADGNVTVVLLQDVNEQVVLATGVVIDRNGFALDKENVSAAKNYSVEQDDDILRVLVGYEALVDGVVYSTINAAIEAVKDGGTIKVAKNCTATVKVAHECVVNLAGFVVTGLAADEEKGFRMDVAGDVCTVTHPYVACVEGVEFESLSAAIAAVVEMAVPDCSVEIVLEKDVSDDIVVGAPCKFELMGDFEFTGTITAQADDKDLSVSRNGMTWTVVAAQTMPLTDTAAVKVSSDVFAAVKEQVEAVKKEESGEEVEATDVEVKEAIAVAIETALDVTPKDQIGEGLAKIGTDAESQLKTIDVEIDKNTDKAKLDTGLYQPTKIVEIEVGEGETKQVARVVVLNEDPGVKPDALITTMSKRSSLILAVPGNRVNVEGVSVPVTVANVIASKPSENDTIALWKQVGGETVGYSWSWHGGDWVANKATRKDADGNEVVTDEDSPKSNAEGVLAVGMAFRYERLSGSTDPVTVVAQFDEAEEVRTTVQEDGWNVVANPNVDQPFDLSEIKPETGAQDAAENLEKDQIVVPIGDVGERVYTYKANEGWGYEASETRKVGTLTIVRKVRKTDHLKVDSGKGFWYFSGGTKPTINWRKKASAQ